MKNLFFRAWCVVLLAGPAFGAAEFSRSLSAGDFAAAGLGKLTPAELARLDALVRDRRTGEVARTREETAAQVPAETTAGRKAGVTAENAGAKPADGGSLLHRLRVVLTPGTDIEYAAVETQLVGKFRGYEPGKVLTLSNGQQWRVIEGSFWAPARDADRPHKVVIEPGALGGFFLRIENGGRPRVKIVSNPR